MDVDWKHGNNGRLVRVSVSPDGTKVAEYESAGQVVERLATAALTAQDALCPKGADRIASAAADLAEWIARPSNDVAEGG